jgi:hypothetical protein
MKKRYRKSIGSYQNQLCINDEALRRYKYESVDSAERERISSHLDQCGTCRELLEMISRRPPAVDPGGSDDEPDAFGLSILDKLRNEKPFFRPIPLKPDQVYPWQIRATRPGAYGCIGVPVLIISVPEAEDSLPIYRGIPISWDTNYLQPGESIVLKSGLNSDFLVPLFNERPFLASSLCSFLGDLSKEERDLLRSARDRYLDLEASQKKTFPLRYRQWKEKERAIAEYLTLPVNEALRLAELEIEVQPVRKFALDRRPLPRILLEAELAGFELLLIQGTDKALLRVVCEEGIVLEDVKVNGEIRSIQPVAESPGIFQVELGFVDKPRPLRVEIVINGASYRFSWDFIEPMTEHSEE